MMTQPKVCPESCWLSHQQTSTGTQESCQQHCSREQQSIQGSSQGKAAHALLRCFCHQQPNTPASDSSQYFQPEAMLIKLSSTPSTKIWTWKHINPFCLVKNNKLPATFLPRQGSSSTNTAQHPAPSPAPCILPVLLQLYSISQHLQALQKDLQPLLSSWHLLACPLLSPEMGPLLASPWSPQVPGMLSQQVHPTGVLCTFRSTPLRLQSGL